MKWIKNRLFAVKCEHNETIVVRSVGVQRTVCENCGHVSFSIAPTIPTAAGTTRPDKNAPLRRASGL